MAYARFGMDVTAAQALTGDAGITDPDLEAAEDDLEELLGYAITEGTGTYDVNPDTFTGTLLGRAVAWQAAYRRATSPGATAGTVAGDAMRSENIGDYSYTREDGSAVKPDPVAPRARDLLARSGLLAERMTGRTHDGTARTRVFPDNYA